MQLKSAGCWIVALAGGTPAAANVPAPFSQGELEAMIAPGALYPDALLSQMLMASTYPHDTAAGAEELIARRIGRNELDTMQVCLAVVDMEREYAEIDRNGDGTLEYTARLISTQGRHDGLYWQTQPGKLIGGFALIAWPASYLSSGVKTFSCNMDGIVYERDFGPDTAAAVAKIATFDPGPGWSKAK